MTLLGALSRRSETVRAQIPGVATDRRVGIDSHEGAGAVGAGALDDGTQIAGRSLAPAPRTRDDLVARGVVPAALGQEGRVVTARDVIDRVMTGVARVSRGRVCGLQRPGDQRGWIQPVRGRWRPGPRRDSRRVTWTHDRSGLGESGCGTCLLSSGGGGSGARPGRAGESRARYRRRA